MAKYKCDCGSERFVTVRPVLLEIDGDGEATAEPTDLKLDPKATEVTCRECEHDAYLEEFAVRI